MFLYRGKVVKRFEDELWEGYNPVPFPKLDSASLKFRGKKMPIKIWGSVVAFMVDSFNVHGEEAQLNLMFNVKTQEWKPWVFPQFMMGMHTEADTEDPEFDKQRDEFGPDWVVGGTVHHHCALAAFASGTDNKDELDKDGVHITLGKMGNETCDSDVRVLYNGIKYEGTLSEFVDCEALFEFYHNSGINEDVAEDLVNQYLCSIYGTYPDEWMGSLKKKATTKKAPGKTSSTSNSKKSKKKQKVNGHTKTTSPTKRIGVGI